MYFSWVESAYFATNIGYAKLTDKRVNVSIVRKLLA
jgi:hypothetical protein